MIANVFLAHTPFQNFMAHHMLRTLPEFRGTHNVLVACLEMPRITRELWNRVIEISPPLNPRFSLRTLVAARRWAAAVLEPLAGCGTVSVFLANTDLPIGNAFYEWTRKGRPFRFCSLPEGVGSIFPGRFRCSKKLKLMAKRCVAAAAFQSYTAYEEHFASLATADRIYTLAPEYMPQYAQLLTRIPAPQYPASALCLDSWLVLGQAFDKFMPNDAGKRLVEDLRGYVLANSAGSLTYKPHHHENGSIAESFRRSGFELLQDTRPVEELFLDRPFGTVIGIGSSALLHLKLFLRERVRCISFHSHIPARYTRDMPERHWMIYTAFRDAGIEIVD